VDAIGEQKIDIVVSGSGVMKVHDTWGNSTQTIDDWMASIRGTDEAAKRRLFKKLFLESSDGAYVKAFFDEAEIRSYLSDFDKPLVRAHQERRRKVWRFLYLGERSSIPELDWTIGK